jgi:hypothetical protein
MEGQKGAEAGWRPKNIGKKITETFVGLIKFSTFAVLFQECYCFFCGKRS